MHSHRFGSPLTAIRSARAGLSSSALIAAAACPATSLGAGAASAQTHDCSAPTATLCRNRDFLLACDTAAVQAYCEPALDTALQQGATDGVPLYTPNQPKTLGNPAGGKARPYVFSTPSRTLSEQLADAMSQAWEKEERRARERAWALPRTTPANAAEWRRDGRWDASMGAIFVDPNTISSCEEFVYERFYTYERFLDASYRCQQDPWCIADLVDDRFLSPTTASSSPGGLRDVRSRWGAIPAGDIE